jgi:hypothetical protein
MPGRKAQIERGGGASSGAGSPCCMSHQPLFVFVQRRPDAQPGCTGQIILEPGGGTTTCARRGGKACGAWPSSGGWRSDGGFCYPAGVNTIDQAGAFPPTRWSLVLAAGGSTSAAARQALETLCANYWPPIYAFLRRAGHSAEDARDLTQAFFVHLLTSATFATADATRGRFRSYLLEVLRRPWPDQTG